MAQAQILIVEDEWILADNLKDRLQAWGYAVPAVASTGEEAIRKAGQAKPDLALMDINLAGPMDGVQAADEIRARFDVPVIYITAYADDEILERARITEPFGYVLKPFRARELHIAIEMALYKHSAEKELKQYQEHLEELVQERTAELRRAYNKLEQLDQDKLTFLHYLSHELNTPLSWIGLSETLIRNQIGDEGVKYLDMVRQGFDRLNDLVKAVLRYFELTRGDLDLELAPVSLRDMIIEMVNQKKSALEKKNLKVVSDFRDNGFISADREYFREVLETLLDNAINFTYRRGTIQIETEAFEDKTRLIVADEGKGIDEADLENIFLPFVIEDFKRREGGCGLNLPKAKIIVEAHGWEIWAESAGQNRGAKFILEMTR